MKYKHRNIRDISDDEAKDINHRHFTYKIKKNDVKEEEKEPIIKKQSIRRAYSLKRIKKKLNHRHHHYQHYRKPKRIIMAENLGSFSIIQKIN